MSHNLLRLTGDCGDPSRSNASSGRSISASAWKWPPASTPADGTTEWRRRGRGRPPGSRRGTPSPGSTHAATPTSGPSTISSGLATHHEHVRSPADQLPRGRSQSTYSVWKNRFCFFTHSRRPFTKLVTLTLNDRRALECIQSAIILFLTSEGRPCNGRHNSLQRIDCEQRQLAQEQQLASAYVFNGPFPRYISSVSQSLGAPTFPSTVTGDK